MDLNMSGDTVWKCAKIKFTKQKLTGKPRIIKEYCNEEISVGMKDILEHDYINLCYPRRIFDLNSLTPLLCSDKNGVYDC